MTKRPLLALTLLAALLLLAPAAPAGADELWSRDFEGAFAEARESGRLVLVEFYADFCGTCVQMDKTTLRDASVKKAISSFVAVRVPCDDTHPIAKRYRVSELPTFIAFDADRLIVGRTMGFKKPEELKAELARMSQAAPKLGQAHAKLKTAVKEAPGAESRKRLVDFYVRRGNLLEACQVLRAQLLDTSVELETRMMAAAARARMELMMSRFESCEVAVREGLAVNGEHTFSAMLIFLRGYSLETRKRESEAAKDYLHVVRHFPGTKAAEHATGRLRVLGV